MRNYTCGFSALPRNKLKLCFPKTNCPVNEPLCHSTTCLIDVHYIKFRTLNSFAPPKHALPHHVNGSFCNMCDGCCAGVTYLRYTVLTSPNKAKQLPTLAILLYRSCHVGVSKRFFVGCLWQATERFGRGSFFIVDAKRQI